MINFCTLFDSNYLTRGLALYESLKRNASSFHLYVIAFNKDAYDYLKQASLPNLTAISLNEFEDPELLKIKPSRSAAEYCWTCTPSVILYCLNKFNLPSCTYIDADMIFYHDPKVLVDEMGDKSVLITEHRYTKDYDQSAISGRYCVQFMCFRNNEEGLKVLHWWRERCIEWCYARVEDGKFGDQKYLDNWTEQFTGIHVLEHQGGGVAPWNVQQYTINPDFTIVEKSSGRKFPLVFFHFHGLKFYTDGWVSCSGVIYDLAPDAKKYLYLPYINSLLELENRIRKKVSFNINGARTAAPAKSKVYLEYFKERIILWRIGNFSVLQLKLLDYPKHYHYFNVKELQGENAGK
jgi:hypothetical protein